MKFGFNKRSKRDEGPYEDELYDDEEQYEDEDQYDDEEQYDEQYDEELDEIEELTLDDIDAIDEGDGHVYATTKWYESTLNVVIASVVAGSLLVGTWYFAGDAVLDLFGIGQSYVEEQDIGGRLERYQQDIQGEIDGLIKPDVGMEDGSVSSELPVDPVTGLPVAPSATESGTVVTTTPIQSEQIPDKAGPGTYLVGVDIKQGSYLMGTGSTYSKYADEYSLMNDDPIESTRDKKRSEGNNIVHRPTKANKVHTLLAGTYIVIEEGGMVNNVTRPPSDMKINESVVLLNGNHYTVGIDIPAGYYKIKAVQLNTKTQLDIKNPTLELQMAKYKADRQTYVQLIKGNIFEVDNDTVLTRVDMDFVY